MYHQNNKKAIYRNVLDSFRALRTLPWGADAAVAGADAAVELSLLAWSPLPVFARNSSLTGILSGFIGAASNKHREYNRIYISKFCARSVHDGQFAKYSCY